MDSALTQSTTRLRARLEIELVVNGQSRRLELRLTNDTDIDPELGVPLSGRRLADCLRESATRFGWEQRPKAPASRREGSHLIGYGMAAPIRLHAQVATEATCALIRVGR